MSDLYDSIVRLLPGCFVAWLMLFSCLFGNKIIANYYLLIVVAILIGLAYQMHVDYSENTK